MININDLFDIDHLIFEGQLTSPFCHVSLTMFLYPHTFRLLCLFSTLRHQTCPFRKRDCISSLVPYTTLQPHRAPYSSFHFLVTLPLAHDTFSSKASKLYNQHLDPSPFFQTPVMPYRFRPLERLVLAAIDMRVSPRKSNPWQLDIHAYSSVITRLFTHVDKELFNRIFQCTEGQAIQLSIRLSGNQHHDRK